MLGIYGVVSLYMFIGDVAVTTTHERQVSCQDVFLVREITFGVLTSLIGMLLMIFIYNKEKGISTS